MLDYKDLRVALIGCGYWGRNHARVLYELGARATYCDSNPNVLRELKGRFPDARYVSSAEAVLADPEIDAVIVASPAVTHFQTTLDAIKAGKHVLVEKPLALHAADGVDLVRAAKAHDRVLMVGHLLRYHPAVVKLKELISLGTFGEIHYIYSNRLNMGKVRKEENALWSFAPHDISVIQYLLDQTPSIVSSSGGAYLQPEVADVSLSSFLFGNGVRAHVFVSWLHPFKEQKMVVIGSNGMAIFDDRRAGAKLVVVRGKVEVVNGQFEASLPQEEVVEIEPSEPLKNEVSHFLDCVRDGTQPFTDGAEGLRVLRVLEACQSSLTAGGAPIELFVEV